MTINESDSGSHSGSESEGEEIALHEPSKKAIFNKEGLLEKLEDISWPADVEWVHKLTIDHDQEQAVDVNDDIVRELAFYSQALDGVRQAYAKLDGMGIPFFRPADYYAEMVKTDSHMLKVKSKLLVQKQKIEEAEERKKAREVKKISKQMQAQKQRERAKEKKEEIESVKKWRKQRQQSGFAQGKDDDIESMFEEKKSSNGSNKRKPLVAPGDRSGGKFGKGQDKAGKKREKRNSRFGHGGRKGLKKQNTAETTNDLKGFNQRSAQGNKRTKK